MTPRWQAVLVDDEPLARKRLRALLRDEPEVQVVAEAESGPAAVEAVRRHRPDLLFLDVQMPEMDGFAVLAELAADRRPLPVVVFVTAYDEHAVRAFEVHALDYLMKPVERERFAQALARAKEALRGRRERALDERLGELLAERPGRGPLQRLAVRKGERTVVLRADEIDWVEAAGNYLVLHVAAESYLLRETMQALEGRLDPQRFARIHRSTIVNLDRVRELSPSFHGDFFVVLADGQRLTLSRTYRERVEALLGKL